MHVSSYTRTHKQNAGFSVIELLITISIIVLVTGLALSRYSTFDNTILLQSQAFEISFDIRQAQQSGISVRATESNIRRPFGIYFDETDSNQYIFFQDNNNNEQYDAGSDPVLQTFLIDTRFEIIDVRTTGNPGTTAASVTFKRPNFDARVSPGGDLEVEIATSSGSPHRKIIRVTETGQITVE